MKGKNIPNTITSLNLASGCAASIFAVQGDYRLAAYLILLSAIFDFFDGFAARLLKAFSPIGKELDSLADVVSFGVAPGLMIFTKISETGQLAGYPQWLAWFALLIPVFSALRLAKFNLDERQSSSFLGLPTPANALFWAFGIAFALSGAIRFQFMPFFLILGVIVFSALLVSEIPMFSLKFKNMSFRDNKIQFIFLSGCLLLMIIFGMSGISASIMLYIILSAFSNLFVNNK
jgi:CDP-diacylglycerol--serine O-phosphatidyltransferase